MPESNSRPNVSEGYEVPTELPGSTGCMAINVSVQDIGGFILLTQCYYHRCVLIFRICSRGSHLNVLTFPPLMLRRSRCVQIFLKQLSRVGSIPRWYDVDVIVSHLWSPSAISGKFLGDQREIFTNGRKNGSGKVLSGEASLDAGATNINHNGGFIFKSDHGITSESLVTVATRKILDYKYYSVVIRNTSRPTFEYSMRFSGNLRCSKSNEVDAAFGDVFCYNDTVLVRYSVRVCVCVSVPQYIAAKVKSCLSISQRILS